MKKLLAPFSIPAILLLVLLALVPSCTKKADNPTGPGTQQPATTLGQLTLDPSGVLAGTAATVTVHLTVPASVKLADSVIRLEHVSSGGQALDTVGSLYDDGKLNHADDIKGDKVFSNKLVISQTSAEDYRLRASASIASGVVSLSASSEVTILKLYADLSAEEFHVIDAVQRSAAAKMNGYVGGNSANFSKGLDSLRSWMASQPGVASATRNGTASISILYTSGIYGGIIFTLLNENGVQVTRGGQVSDNPRRRSTPIPLRQQTIGQYFQTSGRLPKTNADLDPTVIGNRKVLIYAPFETYFAPYNEGPNAKVLFESASQGFQVTYLSNAEANIPSLTRLTEYGFVLLATHGSQGREFGTGETVDTNASLYKASYKALLKAQKIAIWNNVTISRGWIFDSKASVYAIRSPFIDGLQGKFPNSVVLNNSCESTMNDDLYLSFMNKGAKSYYGYTRVVNSGFCMTNSDTIIKRLVMDGKITGDAYVPANDPVTPNATIQLKIATGVHYPDSLVNGDFELGTINGWTTQGDGRLISQLATQNPTGGSYMGIISTGLGYTTSTGSISQSFRVRQGQTTITVKWNFLSEEFLEFIGSSFQDYFEVAIRTGTTETILLRKTIDNLAAAFGASKLDPGNLIKASPAIVFDRGDVFMTGWQTSTLDVSAYVNQKVTLILRAGDVGDSVYDTAILIDDVAVK